MADPSHTQLTSDKTTASTYLKIKRLSSTGLVSLFESTYTIVATRIIKAVELSVIRVLEIKIVVV
jgi:hypothetical protein